MEESAKKHLLEKYMDGLCSEKELREVALIRQQPGTERLWDELIIARSGGEWNKDISPDAELQEITARRMTQLMNKIAATEQGHLTVKDDHPVRKFYFLRHAAIWTGLLMVASVAFWQLKKAAKQNANIVYVDKINMQGGPVKYVLPDSSEVFLGAGSKLHYPEKFGGDTREIELEGEAFFQVMHNVDKPFIIHTGDVQTEVLGTSFKILAFKQQAVMVAVATGKVSVSAQAGGHSKTLALLTPGLKVTWDNHTGKAVQGKVDVYSLERWKNGEMIFDEQLLGDVADELQRRYGIRIVFKDNEAANYRVGGTFSAKEPIGRVMKMLSVVGEFKYESIDDKTYNIYKIK